MHISDQIHKWKGLQLWKIANSAGKMLQHASIKNASVNYSTLLTYHETEGVK